MESESASDDVSDCESDDEMWRRLVSDELFTSGDEDETASLQPPDSEDEDLDNFDTTMLTGDDTCNAAELEAVLLNRGDAPKNLKRRKDGILYRDGEGDKKLGKVNRLDRTTNAADSEPLIGLPADLGWSAMATRRPRPIDFTPKEKPGNMHATKSSYVIIKYVHNCPPYTFLCNTNCSVRTSMELKWN